MLILSKRFSFLPTPSVEITVSSTFRLDLMRSVLALLPFRKASTDVSVDSYPVVVVSSVCLFSHYDSTYPPGDYVFICSSSTIDEVKNSASKYTGVCT